MASLLLADILLCEREANLLILSSAVLNKSRNNARLSKDRNAQIRAVFIEVFYMDLTHGEYNHGLR